jgi:hypothetical protein
MIDEAGADHEMTAVEDTAILLRATTSVLAAVPHAAAVRAATEAASAAALAAAAKEARSAASAADSTAIAADSAARGASVPVDRVLRVRTRDLRATKRAGWQSGSTRGACPH